MNQPKRLRRPPGSGRSRPAKKTWPPPSHLRLLPPLAELLAIDRGEPVEPEPPLRQRLLPIDLLAVVPGEK